MNAEDVRVTVEFVIGPTDSDTVPAQHQCQESSDAVSCLMTVSDTVGELSAVYVEYIAAHETCHLKLEHYRFNIMDFLLHGDEIELQTDRCAFQLIGADKFFESLAEDFYTVLNYTVQQIPRDKLRAMIIQVYGHQE